MQAPRRRLLQTLLAAAVPAYSRDLTYKATTARDPHNGSFIGSSLRAPWLAIQHRGAKVLGADVRLGNIIQRKGRIFQVLKAQHTQHGRGGATIQVELRDVDTGNKITERFRTDEAIERVFVEDKSFTFLYQDGDSVMIMDPNTYEQMDIPKELFGKRAAYVKDNMTVTLQFYNGKPMSASVPQRVTCTVAEAKPVAKGQTASPQYKRVLLENGITVLAPSFIKVGDEIVVNTTDDSYMTRHMQAPRKPHLDAIHIILRYLNGSPRRGILLSSAS